MKTKKIFKMIPVLLCAVIMTVSFTGCIATVPEEDFNALMEQHTELKEEAEALKVEVEVLKEQVIELQTQLSEYEDMENVIDGADERDKNQLEDEIDDTGIDEDDTEIVKSKYPKFEASEIAKDADSYAGSLIALEGSVVNSPDKLGVMNRFALSSSGEKVCILYDSNIKGDYAPADKVTIYGSVYGTLGDYEEFITKSSGDKVTADFPVIIAHEIVKG